MKLLKSLIVLVVLSLSHTAHAVLVDGSVLDFTEYTGGDLTGNGSWFNIESSGATGISSYDGLVIGTVQTESGSHFGLPDGSESPTIDNPHTWLGETGMFGTVSPSDIITASGNTATIDFSGLSWSWNGSDNMLMFEPDLGDTGVASIVCAVNCGIGETYVLDYTGHIDNAASGLSGYEIIVHLEGTISAVPVPATLWLFGSGLFGLIGFVRRRSAV